MLSCLLLQGTLEKLREERGAAQTAMRQHSQWLQGFREQVAQVAALQPVVAGKLSQHSSQRKAPVAAAAAAKGGTGGDGPARGSLSASLSPVAG